MTGPSRVCVLINGDEIESWAADALEHMTAKTEAEIELLVSNESHTNSRDQENGIWDTLLGIRNHVKNKPWFLQKRKIDTVECLTDTEQIRCSPISLDNELGHKLPDEVVSEVANKTDVVIRFGFGILKGEILRKPKYGVLSFHHGDIRHYRGGPQGFWEFLNDESTAGVTLQQLTETLDGGKIVALSLIEIDDCFTWQDVRSKLFETSTTMLTDGIQNLQSEEFHPTEPDELGDLYTSTRNRQLAVAIRYLIKNNIGRIKKYLREG